MNTTNKKVVDVYAQLATNTITDTKILPLFPAFFAFLPATAYKLGLGFYS